VSIQKSTRGERTVFWDGKGGHQSKEKPSVGEGRALSSVAKGGGIPKKKGPLGFKVTGGPLGLGRSVLFRDSGAGGTVWKKRAKGASENEQNL